MRIHVERFADALRARGWRVSTTAHVAYCHWADADMIVSGQSGGRVLAASGPLSVIVEALEAAASCAESESLDCQICGGTLRIADGPCPSCSGAPRQISSDDDRLTPSQMEADAAEADSKPAGDDTP